MIKTKAFTLAEVLITLGIIGVVAAMTMPSLIANHREKENVVKLKKVYSTLSNAYLLAKEEYGTPDNWDLKANDDPDGAENELNIFAKYMNVAKNCGRNPGCWPLEQYRFLKGTPYNIDHNTNISFAKLVLNDGTTLTMNVRDPDCKQIRGSNTALSSTCGTISADINGAKLPNQIGKDLFVFVISKEGIFPHGTQDETMFSFANSCKDKNTADGWGCAAWVIFNENQDYLHCNDLGWDMKIKCN